MKIRFYSRTFLATLLSGFMLTGCSSNDEPTIKNELDRKAPAEYPEMQLSRAERDIAIAQNNYSMKLFLRECGPRIGSGFYNCLYSPLSSALYMSMVANATDDESLRLILDDMEQPDLASLNEYNAKLMDYLRIDNPHMYLSVANKLLFDEGCTIKDSFSSTMLDYYKFVPENCPIFDYKRLSAAVGRWSSDVTGGRVNFDKPLRVNRTDCKVYVANVVAFDALWMNEFKKDGTMTFKGSDGVENVTKLKSTTCAWVWKDKQSNSQIVRIPYIDDRFRFTAILPPESENNGLINVIDNLIIDNLEPDILNAPEYVKPMTYTIIMPEISISADNQVYGYQYKEESTEKDPRVEFNWNKAIEEANIGQAGWFMLQKCSISFSEEGTKAITTSQSHDQVCSAFGDAERIVLNRPFVFFITDKETGSIILGGVINKIND